VTAEPAVAHVWDDLVPGHLPHRYGSRGVVVARRLLHNGGAVEPDTVALHELEAARALGTGKLTRAIARAGEPLEWRRMRALVAREVRARRLNMIHGHFGTTAARMVPVAAALDVPLIATFYGVDASAVLRMAAWQRSYAQLFERASLLVVLCDAVADRLVASGACRDKLAVWNMPAGIERYPPRPRSHGDETRFLVAARFVDKKGYFVLLDAFDRFLETGRKGLLTMIGYGPQRAAIAADAARRGIADRCRLVDTALSADFPSTFDAALTDADVFLMPSITAADGDDEGGPALTMVCAQASGLPVVCTAFPGAERSMIDGVTGRYCAEGDAESLMTRMAELADDPVLARKLGTAGSDLVHREFSSPGQHRAMVQLYDRVLTQGAG
jgi:colanic acid/amylovoran biosynthesis glycosyltransferase